MSSENLHLRRGRGQKGTDVAEKVLVAVKASREIPRTALVWALTHVVQQGKKFWGFPRFSGDCASGHKKSNSGSSLEMKSDISDTCSQMMLQLHNVYDPNKINVKIKIVSGTPIGAVAAESKRVQASWVVLDKQLKHEVRRCMEELQCNIVVMKRSQPKVLRLNLVGSPEAEPQPPYQLLCDLDGVSGKQSLDASGPLNSVRAPAATPTSSPELGTSFTATEAGTSSVSSSDLATSPFSNSDVKRGPMKTEQIDPKENRRSDASSSGSEDENLNPSKSFDLQPWVAELLNHRYTSSKQVNDISHRFGDKMQMTYANAISAKFSKLDGEAGVSMMSHQPLLESTYNGNVREAISLSRSAPLGPPPLCSICQHKAPVFGKPPRLFNYAELELATGGFSQANFLAEGGFGSVHRGVLPDGQVVAVKQHKLASSQGDLEFCSEVEVLSCAQHRNVVMLIGFCVEDRKRLLVYEYICNGSLDSHLYGRNREPLRWPSRQKVAVGAARGLRYLHEECRVGCIVHRDMRPNNILLTHDFEPLVGDFGLARWQPDGDKGMKTRVIGTLGYLAPEYAQSGQITEKADVYSFGVVLLELVTGRKAVDINRPKGQQCLTEWARPLLEGYATDNLVDPRLGNQFSEQELYCMLHAASLCIRRDPHARPRMSQVLRALEGDMVMEPSHVQSPGCDAGSRSRRMRAEETQRHHGGSTADHREISGDTGGTLAYATLRAAYLQKARPAPCDDED